MTNPNLPKLPKGAPTKPWASRLCPFEDEIRTLRRAQKTYQEIADALAEAHGLKVTRQAVSDFVRVRAKRRPYELPEPVSALPIPAPARTQAQAPKAAQTRQEPHQPAANAAPASTPSTVPQDRQFARVVDEGGKVLKGMQYGVVNPADL